MRILNTFKFLFLAASILCQQSEIRADESSIADRLRNIEERVLALEKEMQKIVRMDSRDPLPEILEPAIVPIKRLELLAANTPLLATEAQALPYYKNGIITGLRLFGIKHGSYFEQIGLKNSDIVLTVSGKQVSDLTTLIELITKGLLRSEAEQQVAIIRAGQNIFLRVIREQAKLSALNAGTDMALDAENSFNRC